MSGLRTYDHQDLQGSWSHLTACGGWCEKDGFDEGASRQQIVCCETMTRIPWSYMKNGSATIYVVVFSRYRSITSRTMVPADQGTVCSH
jgi:hypothetical protein